MRPNEHCCRKDNRAPPGIDKNSGGGRMQKIRGETSFGWEASHKVPSTPIKNLKLKLGPKKHSGFNWKGVISLLLPEWNRDGLPMSSLNAKTNKLVHAYGIQDACPTTPHPYGGTLLGPPMANLGFGQLGWGDSCHLTLPCIEPWAPRTMNRLFATHTCGARPPPAVGTAGRCRAPSAGAASASPAW